MPRKQAVKLSYNDLIKSVSEYHFMVFNVPLDLAGEPTSVVLTTIKAIEQYISAMQQSFNGREALRVSGWQIEEHEPLLQQIAEELAGEREFNGESFLRPRIYS